MYGISYSNSLPVRISTRSRQGRNHTKMPSASIQNLVEVDSLEIHILVNDEIDQISPSPNALVKHTQSFTGVPLSPVADPAARGGARLEMPMRNICCGAHGLSLFLVSRALGSNRDTKANQALRWPRKTA